MKLEVHNTLAAGATVKVQTIKEKGKIMKFVKCFYCDLGYPNAIMPLEEPMWPEYDFFGRCERCAESADFTIIKGQK